MDIFSPLKIAAAHEPRGNYQLQQVNHGTKSRATLLRRGCYATLCKQVEGKEPGGDGPVCAREVSIIRKQSMSFVLH